MSTVWTSGGELDVRGVWYAWPVEEMATSEQRFAWIDDLEEDYILPTVTVVEGVGRAEVVRRLGGDPRAGRWMTARQMVDEALRERSADLVGVVTVGGLVCMVEVASSVGAVPEVVSALSRGGRCFGVWVDINGGDTVHYAVDGELVVFEEHSGPIRPLQAGDPRWDPRLCRGLIDVEDETAIWGVKIFALMERVMGVTVQPIWFTEPLETFAVPPASGQAGTAAWDVP